MTIPLFNPGHFTPAQNQRDLSQWFTPQPLADRLVRWALARWGAKPGWRVLEPSCGGGALVEPLALLGMDVTALEIDPAMAVRTEKRCEVRVITGDYLATRFADAHFDASIKNPPYEDGADGRFLAKAMRESLRVAGIFRTAVLDGKERREAVWSQVESGLWRLSGVAHLGRVAFDIPGDVRKPQSASTDFVALTMERASVTAYGSGTEIEWWT